MLRSLYFTSLIIDCNNIKAHMGKHLPMIEKSTHWSVRCLSCLIFWFKHCEPLSKQSQVERCNSSGVLKCPCHHSKNATKTTLITEGNLWSCVQSNCMHSPLTFPYKEVQFGATHRWTYFTYKTKYMPSQCQT